MPIEARELSSDRAPDRAREERWSCPRTGERAGADRPPGEAADTATASDASAAADAVATAAGAVKDGGADLRGERALPSDTI